MRALFVLLIILIGCGQDQPNRPSYLTGSNAIKPFPAHYLASFGLKTGAYQKGPGIYYWCEAVDNNNDNTTYYRVEGDQHGWPYKLYLRHNIYNYSEMERSKAEYIAMVRRLYHQITRGAPPAKRKMPYKYSNRIRFETFIYHDLDSMGIAAIETKTPIIDAKRVRYIGHSLKEEHQWRILGSPALLHIKRAPLTEKHQWGQPFSIISTFYYPLKSDLAIQSRTGSQQEQ